MDPDEIRRIVEKHKKKREGLISILDDIQSQYNYLPQDALKIVSKNTGYSLIDIYGVATFYKAFSIKPRGKHLICVCLGTACHVRGSPQIADEFKRLLKINEGETTPDRLFTLESVNCVGACALGPIVIVDGEPHSHISVSKVQKIIKNYSKIAPNGIVSRDERIFQVNVSCPRCNHSFMNYERLINGHPSIRVTISFERKHGWLCLSSLYGDFTIESEYEIPWGIVANFFCPKCHAELRPVRDCPKCDAPMIPMIVQGGAMLQICSRRGCKEHMLDLSGVNI